MIRYFIELSYDGAAYCGWQKQPGSPSVQQTLEECLGLLAVRPVEITGCGRTDTGVSATVFYAHFDTEKYFEPKDALLRLNRMLPGDIAIRRMFQCGLHSRFDAYQREYKYYIAKEKDPFDTHCWTISRHLDLPKMQSAAVSLMDYSDFTSFAKLHGNAKTNICTLYYANWEDIGERIVFTISANRFLRGMVRAIVGTLVDVGLGKISLERFSEIVKAKDRSLASMQAPACGLFLTDVRYPGIG